jgi:hypothetical protein
LTWSDNSANEQGFAIERCVDSGCINFAPLQTVGANATGYTDSGLAAQKVYRYRVRAYGTAGNSPYSNIAEATTPAPPPLPPAAPSNLGTTAPTSSSITLNWSDNSGDEDGFAIERCVDSGCINFVPLQTVGRQRHRLHGFRSCGSKALSLSRAGLQHGRQLPVLEHCGSDHSCTAPACLRQRPVIWERRRRHRAVSRSTGPTTPAMKTVSR